MVTSVKFITKTFCQNIILTKYSGCVNIVENVLQNPFDNILVTQYI